MSDAQIFQLLGLGYVVIGAGVLLNPAFYQKMLKSFEEVPAVLWVAGVLTLLGGFVLVSFHNTWVWDRSVLITIFGWLMLLRGLFTLIAPVAATRLTSHFARQKPPFIARGVLITGIGVVFLLLGIIR